MTLFSDGVQIGGRRARAGRKVRSSSLVYLDFVPATLDRDGICAAQQLGAAGNLTLNGALVSNGRAVLGSGAHWYGRCVGVYSAADLSARTVTLYGYDVDDQPLIENIAAPNNTTTAGLKAFKSVVRAYIDGAVASDIEIGSIDKFGLPARLTSVTQIARCGWAGTLAENAATFAAGVTTSPATAITGDVRGTVIPGSSAADGSRRLTVVMVPDLTSNDTFFGVRQYGSF